MRVRSRGGQCVKGRHEDIFLDICNLIVCRFFSCCRFLSINILHPSFIFLSLFFFFFFLAYIDICIRNFHLLRFNESSSSSSEWKIPSQYRIKLCKQEKEREKKGRKIARKKEIERVEINGLDQRKINWIFIPFPIACERERERVYTHICIAAILCVKKGRLLSPLSHSLTLSLSRWTFSNRIIFSASKKIHHRLEMKNYNTFDILMRWIFFSLSRSDWILLFFFFFLFRNLKERCFEMNIFKCRCLSQTIHLHSFYTNKRAPSESDFFPLSLSLSLIKTSLIDWIVLFFFLFFRT